MKSDDYRCDNSNCKQVFEHFVRSGDLPKTISCPKCGHSSHRRFSVSAIDIAVGSVGNYDTGYEKQIGYQHSKFGKFKGKRIK